MCACGRPVITYDRRSVSLRCGGVGGVRGDRGSGVGECSDDVHGRFGHAAVRGEADASPAGAVQDESSLQQLCTWSRGCKERGNESCQQGEGTDGECVVENMNLEEYWTFVKTETTER